MEDQENVPPTLRAWKAPSTASTAVQPSGNNGERQYTFKNYTAGSSAVGYGGPAMHYNTFGQYVLPENNQRVHAPQGTQFNSFGKLVPAATDLGPAHVRPGQYEVPKSMQSNMTADLDKMSFTGLYGNPFSSGVYHQGQAKSKNHVTVSGISGNPGTVVQGGGMALPFRKKGIPLDPRMNHPECHAQQQYLQPQQGNGRPSAPGGYSLAPPPSVTYDLSDMPNRDNTITPTPNPAIGKFMGGMYEPTQVNIPPQQQQYVDPYYEVHQKQLREIQQLHYQRMQEHMRGESRPLAQVPEWMAKYYQPTPGNETSVPPTMRTETFHQVLPGFAAKPTQGYGQQARAQQIYTQHPYPAPTQAPAPGNPYIHKGTQIINLQGMMPLPAQYPNQGYILPNLSQVNPQRFQQVGYHPQDFYHAQLVQPPAGLYPPFVNYNADQPHEEQCFVYPSPPLPGQESSMKGFPGPYYIPAARHARFAPQPVEDLETNNAGDNGGSRKAPPRGARGKGKGRTRKSKARR
ncbi:hypothetical protein K470DRAFT_262406 [Piedraia hortae CBS 480.64]|uniref:Uncharacterized protein n=1 Tax=Piedraia hortae CBS 480.64 TaxID=1314780 RepID=A0A6A7C5X0_9PEZI|nr:hypothetical protein K470DRAFT_262406 [Piedraia hortae CBS 480.64]